MRYLRTSVFAFGLAVASVAAPMTVAAQQSDDMISFQSPSKNITCWLTGGWALCSIADFSPSFKRPPKDCDFDWEGWFEVGSTGPGMKGCVSDYLGRPQSTLPYGSEVSYRGITCTSKTTGVTCRNRSGGGFSLRRAEQRIF